MKQIKAYLKNIWGNLPKVPASVPAAGRKAGQPDKQSGGQVSPSEGSKLISYHYLLKKDLVERIKHRDI